jgi:hypothetical protein
MEDILIAILSLLGDIIFELFAWVPWDWLWYSNWFPDWEWTRTSTGEPRNTRPLWTVAVINLGMGALFGWLSIFVFASVLIKWGWLRIVLLFISPPTSGLIALRMAERRRRANDQIDSILHFWIALCFSVGFVWTRFVLAHRPG